MGKTNIEWADMTFNPWWGCTKVTPGCKNCYAENVAERFHDEDIWGKDVPRRFFGDKHWKKPLAWDRKAKKEGKRLKVFSGSMCDVFEYHGGNLEDERAKLFRLIHATPHLDWLLLTKRPGIAAQWLSIYSDHVDVPKNIWFGVSVENQKQADIRIPRLLNASGRPGRHISFLSIEPMLGPISIWPWTINPTLAASLNRTQPMIDWVIVGGESGPKKRPFNPDWARSIRDQCKEAGVSFFMKQWDKVQQIPNDLMIREFPGG